MARASHNLASMSVDGLLKLRDDIGAVLSRKAGELKQQLARLTGERPAIGGRGKRTRRSLKGRKVAPKYRGPGGETWAGRGARPKWLVAQLEGGRKLEDFAIAAGASKRAYRKRAGGKRSARSRK